MININLLPSEIKGKIKKSKQTANVFSICLVFFIILIVLTFLLSAYKDRLLKTHYDNEKKQLDAANQSIANYDNLASSAASLTERGKLAIEIDSTRPNWTQILESMINSVPESVQFLSLNADISKSPNFLIEGDTTNDREAIKFKDKLAASAFFKDVAFKSASFDSRTTTDPNSAGKIHFSLEFNLAQYFAKQGNK